MDPDGKALRAAANKGVSDLRSLVREARREAVADSRIHRWHLFHAWTRWRPLVCGDDEGLNWQSRRCLTCGLTEDRRR